MPEKHLYEYAVIRLIPRVEREEFINIGVILYSSQEGFLKVIFHLDEERLLSFARDLDLPQIQDYIDLYRRICQGGKQGGSIGQLPIASRFRWLTANCSTMVQPSPVHPGLCSDAQETLDKLVAKLIL